MKTTVRTLNNEKGFSLIELMIVVAIIGILATIAVPNFNRMQAKAKQSEAKGLLSNVYTAEKTFFGEWSIYYASFADIGFTPEGRSNYHIGFAAAGAPPALPFVASTGAGAGCPSTPACGTIPSFLPTAAADPSLTGATTPAGQADWVAAATAKLLNNGLIDTWTINQDKVIKNNVNGT
jgi:prepilin-type N-terminal cleavage/methylation domain-containing protein